MAQPANDSAAKPTAISRKPNATFISNLIMQPASNILSKPEIVKPKRPIAELLGEYEKRRIQFEKE